MMMLSHVIITLLSAHCVCSAVINNQGSMQFIYRLSHTSSSPDAPHFKPTTHEDGDSALGVNQAPLVVSTSSVTDMCKYKERHYKSGETYVTDCVTCNCRSGVMSCTVTTCPRHSECIRYESVPGRCCPECVEWGCYHDGVGYPRGSRIPTPSCQVCYCPWEGGSGGRARCSRVMCPPAQCVDGKVPAGKCCPECPHGPNCWMGDLVIPFGQDVWIAPCRSCACPPRNVTAQASLKAVCKWHNNCVFG